MVFIVSENKKILMLVFEDILDPTGGMGVHVFNLCMHLRFSCDVTVVCVSSKNKSGFHLVGEKQLEVSYEGWKTKKDEFRVLQVLNNNDFYSQRGEFQELVQYDKFMGNLMALVRNERFDLIHLHDSALWLVARNMRTVFDAPIVMTIHLSNILYPQDKKDEHYRYSLQKEGSAIIESDAIITVSDSYKQALHEKMLVLDQVTVIPNAVDVDFIQSIPYDEDLAKKYKQKTVVFVGRLVPSKGVELLIFAALLMKDYDFILVSSISPTLEDTFYLSAICKRLDKELDNFFWVKNHTQAEKWALMKIAFIAIMPSLHEPFGIVALEWLALGKCPIITKVGGLVEFCNEQNSIMIEPTIEWVVRAISEFVFDETKSRQGIIDAAKITWGDVARMTGEVYQETLEVTN